MTPEPGTDFASVCIAVCPGFRAIGEPRRGRKSELLAGELDGAPVIAKRLLAPNAVWAWYLAREIAIYRGFAAHPPACRVPRLVAADDDRGLLVIERIVGEPLATRRRPAADLSARAIDALVATRTQLAAWDCPLDLPAPSGIRGQLRERLLEDPTAPLEWIRDGIARCARRRLLETDVAHRLDAAIMAHAPIAFGHGDLLLRNVVGSDPTDDGVVLVDWECAGPHIHDWDLALLATQLAPAGRARLGRVTGGATTRRGRAFRALVAFALARELRFLTAFPDPPAATAVGLRTELAHVVAEID